MLDANFSWATPAHRHLQFHSIGTTFSISETQLFFKVHPALLLHLIFVFFFLTLSRRHKNTQTRLINNYREILSKPVVQKATHRAGTPHGLRG